MNDNSKLKKKKMKVKTKIFLGIAIMIIVVSMVLISPLFNIKKISIQDTDIQSRQEIIKCLEGAEGTNGIIYISKNISGIKNINYLFNMRAKDIEDKIIFSFPQLKNVRVKFIFPGTIEVSFGKRAPAYLIQSSGTYICADVEGFILGTYSNIEELSLPVIRGIELDDYKIGQYVDSENKGQIKALKNIFNEIYKSDQDNNDYKLLSNIEIVDVSEYNKIWMFIGGEIVVNFGNIDNVEYKIPALKQILTNENIAGKKGQIDFTSTNAPVFSEDT